MLTAAAFVGRDGDRVLAGSHEGELRLFDAGNGDMLELHEGGHSGPIRTLRTSPPSSCVKPLAITCTRTEVHLWDVTAMGLGATHVIEGSCNGAFSPGAKNLVVVGEDLVGTMRLIDCATGELMQTFTPTPLRPSTGAGGGGVGGTTVPRLHHAMRTADVCFSPGDGGLVLWGNLLWDVRLPHPVQRFDRFSDGGGASFHPSGNEVILNSEVWDLRSDRLLRSVPPWTAHSCLDSVRGCRHSVFRIPKEEPVGITFVGQNIRFALLLNHRRLGLLRDLTGDGAAVGGQLLGSRDGPCAPRWRMTRVTRTTAWCVCTRLED